MPRMKMSDWLLIAANFSDNQEAEKFRRDNGIEIVDTGTSASQPAKQPAAGPLSTVAAGNNAQTPPPLGGFAGVRQEMLDYPARRQSEREAALAKGREYIAQAYGGPNLSQQLFALSKALLSPKPYRGFAGTVANVSSALGDVAKTQQDAQRNRALAEMELRNAYDKGMSDDYETSLKMRYNIAKAEEEARIKEAQAEAAAAKARAPSYQINPLTGKPVEVPKFAHRPVTKADYDAIPVGEFYVVPAGPKAGEIVRKIK